MPSLEVTMLLVPKLMMGDTMKALVELIRENTKIIHKGWNTYGLLYQVEGDSETIRSLIDLGCMEWI